MKTNASIAGDAILKAKSLHRNALLFEQAAQVLQDHKDANKFTFAIKNLLQRADQLFREEAAELDTATEYNNKRLKKEKK